MYILTRVNLEMLGEPRRTWWDTPMEYKSKNFKILICDIPEGKEVDRINSAGTVSPPEEILVQGEFITCDHIYRSPSIDFKDIPEVM